MGNPALSIFLFALGSLLLLDNILAVPFPDSSIIEAAEAKFILRRSRHLQSSSTNPPLTSEQFDLCLNDLSLADSNIDSQLDKSEYISFLSINSANYGYTWEDASTQFSLSELPLEFAMLFHSTACMCAYGKDSASVDFGCCQGAYEHIVIYADNWSNMTKEQDAYTRLFCSEAYYSYSSTFRPTGVSSIPPTTATPETSSPPTTTMSTSVPVPSPTSYPSAVDGTMSPTILSLGSMGPTIISLPTVATTTLSPLSVIPGMPTRSPISTTFTYGPVITSSSMSPTLTTITKPPIGTSLTESPTLSSTILEIGIEYGISSDCGMTAYDVINGNYGITIKEGLITATEVLLVAILNSTYPQNSAEGAMETSSPQSIPSMSPAASLFSVPTMSPTGGGGDQSASAGETTNKSLQAMNVRIRVEGLPIAPLNDHGDDPYNRRRDLAMLSIQERQQKNFRGYHHPLDKLQRLRKGSRSLVYYTEEKPVDITDVEDVLDQACPQGTVCMKVKSTIFVTLEEGDVTDEIEAVIRSDFQKSLEDGSFFSSMPADTIVCPPPSSASPSSIPVNTVEPSPSLVLTTQSPSLTPVAIPTTQPPVTSIPLYTDEPTLPLVLTTQSPSLITPVAIPTSPPPMATIPTTLLPFPTAVTESPSSGSEEVPIGPLNVTIQYNFNNDCGLDSEAILNEEGNTFKDVLVEVTTTATIQILNETYPRLDGEDPARKRGIRVRRRRLVHFDNPTSTSFSSQKTRNLVYYTAEYPVTIDRIIDIESCDAGLNCLLVISTITIILEAGDDPAQISDAIVNGIAASFLDGSIYSTVPPAALECPMV
ncbi:hypothetical protein ACHAXA_003630 [Cyclostephanos tholiformis]|uniref:Uncharacterized protein n=1 Tax=Cyclostephanos tholiformis TaxID=382380 RepID=A0ABD3SPP5_9STRA